MSGGFGSPYSLEFANARDIGTLLASTAFTSVAGSASTNTLGAWTQLTASTPGDAAWIDVYIGSTSLANQASLSLAVGGAGSEIVFVSDLVYFDPSSPGITCYSFPVNIPTGSRLSAAIRSPSANDAVTARVVLRDAALQVISTSGVIDTYGFNQSTTLGAAVNPGGTANTKGSYTQLVAATVNDLVGFILGFDGQNAALAGNATWMIDIAIGGAGVETIIEPNIAVRALGGVTFLPTSIGPIFTPIPAGTRIAARAQSTATTTNIIGMTLYGIRA